MAAKAGSSDWIRERALLLGLVPGSKALFWWGVLFFGGRRGGIAGCLVLFSFLFRKTGRDCGLLVVLFSFIEEEKNQKRNSLEVLGVSTSAEVDNGTLSP